MRKFNERIVELLAPAGNFEIFQSVVETKCDAIYFGGQTLNMRLIRKGFNFTDDELKRAVEMAHKKDKKVYITVNNLVDSTEIDEAREFLHKLSIIRPDALIVQDFAILQIVKEMELPLEMHSSVMMNVHNLAMVRALKQDGFSRVVMSRNNTLEEIKWIRSQVDIEIEYFTHGDMCVAHGAQCYYSSMLFGMSSNRGKCLKPCRWWFSPKPDGEKHYPLAVRDMCMYEYLPEMIHAGVNSFKIEGRMRDKEFITNLINYYGDAMDRFIADPTGYDLYADKDIIFETRKRDMSTAYAFDKQPGEQNLNDRYEGTGKFYSTGKMFSTPTQEADIADDDTETIRGRLTPSIFPKTSPALSVRINNLEQGMAAVEEGVDRIYISGDTLNPDKPFSMEDTIALSEYVKKSNSSTQLYWGTPRMMNEMQFETYKAGIAKIFPYIDGLLVGNLGALYAFRSIGLPIAGDYPLNVMNELAASFYSEHGMEQITASIELGAAYLKVFAETFKTLEYVAHGRIETMYFDHDFFALNNHDLKSPFKLYNEAGEYEIYMDQHHKTHLLSTHRFTILPLLEEMQSLSIAMFRIEAQTETVEALREIIRAFKNGDKNSIITNDVLNKYKYSYEALRFK